LLKISERCPDVFGPFPGPDFIGKFDHDGSKTEALDYEDEIGPETVDRGMTAAFEGEPFGQG
jgi:hypothetical protein